MKRDDQRELDEALSEGFFADRLVEIIDQERSLEHEEKDVFERAIRKIGMVLSGLEHVESGQLDSKAVENIHAYSRAVDFAMFTIGPTPKFRQEFKLALQRMRAELKAALEKGKAVPGDLKETRAFFERMRHATLRTSATYFREGANAPSWLTVTH